jgi:Ca2+-transporting ATPase
VLAIRSERESLFSQGLFSNTPLLLAVLVTSGLQLMAIYAGPLSRLLKTEPLAPVQLLCCMATASVIFIAVEVEKWITRSRRPDLLALGSRAVALVESGH